MERKASKKSRGARPSSRVPFQGLLGDSTEVRVLRALLADPWHDFMKLELAKDAGVTRPSLDRVWKTFLQHGLVFEVRKLGRIRTYRLNAENPLVKDLQRFVKTLGRGVSDQALAKERSRPSRARRP
jgi:DNA-binding transcriptional ArsR family regulator